MTELAIGAVVLALVFLRPKSAGKRAQEQTLAVKERFEQVNPHAKIGDRAGDVGKALIAGAMAGAGAAVGIGAALGTAAGPIGTAVGAAVGAIVGIVTIANHRSASGLLRDAIRDLLSESGVPHGAREIDAATFSSMVCAYPWKLAVRKSDGRLGKVATGSIDEDPQAHAAFAAARAAGGFGSWGASYLSGAHGDGYEDARRKHGREWANQHEFAKVGHIVPYSVFPGPTRNGMSSSDWKSTSGIPYTTLNHLVEYVGGGLAPNQDWWIGILGREPERIEQVLSWWDRSAK